MSPAGGGEKLKSVDVGMWMLGLDVGRGTLGLDMGSVWEEERVGLHVTWTWFAYVYVLRMWVCGCVGVRVSSQSPRLTQKSVLLLVVHCDEVMMGVGGSKGMVLAGRVFPAGG